jgi:rhodanese-related sulfurtransferase
MHSAHELVQQARRAVEQLPPERLARLLSTEPGTVLIDVRESHEVFEHGAIAGALHIPRGLLEFRMPAVDDSRRVVLCCADGDRSALAAVALQAMGYPNVACLDGGVQAWRDAGFATSLDVALDDVDEMRPRRDRARWNPRLRFATAGVVALAVGGLALLATTADGTRDDGRGVAVAATQSPHPSSASTVPPVTATMPPDPLVQRFGTASQFAKVQSCLPR